MDFENFHNWLLFQAASAEQDILAESLEMQVQVGRAGFLDSLRRFEKARERHAAIQSALALYRQHQAYLVGELDP